MVPPSVAIIILNWNGLQDTLECLESVFQNSYPNYSVTVIDNASQNNELDEIKKFCKKKSPSCLLPPFSFLQNEKNLGFSEGNNVGIRKAIQDGAEYIFTLNNDTVVDPNFLVEAIKQVPLSSSVRRGAEEGLRERSGGGPSIIATTMLNYHDRTKIDSMGHDLLTTGDTIPRDRNKILTSLTSLNNLTSLSFGACAGAALYSVDMLRHIGLFDADFFLNYEDSDLSLRALVNGWQIVHCPNSIIYHKGQASIKKLKDPSSSYLLPPTSYFLSPTHYRIRSQRNMLWAYFNNIPLPVILLNLPWLMLRDLLGILLSAMLLRWSITKILICSRWQVLTSLPMIIRKRRKNLKDQKISWFWIWKNQRSWVPVYWDYLKSKFFSL